MESTVFRFILVVLATWRLSHLLTAEDGPADLVVRLRARLGNSMAGRAMDCFYCLSLWISAPLALWLARDVMEWVMVWWGASAGACLLNRWMVSREARSADTTAEMEVG